MLAHNYKIETIKHRNNCSKIYIKIVNYSIK